MKAYHSYEDYDRSARYYDNTRSAVGVEVVLGLLARTGRALSSTSVLDVGCGTGNYLYALAPYVERLTGLEYSPGMLERARLKTADIDVVRLVRGSAFSLPFGNECFHAVMFNQVVHHFDTGADASGEAGFPRLGIALEQAFHALERGGVVMLNHTMQRQMHDGYWWAELFPDAMTRMSRRYIPLGALERMLEATGFAYGGAIVPLDEVLQSRGYLDPEGPLDDSWRRGDSTWTLATADELAAGQARLRAMIADGSITTFMAQREALRRQVGQTVFVWATRPA